MSLGYVVESRIELPRRGIKDQRFAIHTRFEFEKLAWKKVQ